MTPHNTPMAHTMEPLLRKLGLPTRLVKGVVENVAETTICTEGQPLTSNQAALLRHFELKHAMFRVNLVAVWEAEKGGKVDELDPDYLDRVSGHAGVDDQIASRGFSITGKEM